MKAKIIELLKATERERIDKVIDYLENKSDYFIAPASTAFHGNYAGGLAEHSLNVYNVAMKVKAAMLEVAMEMFNAKLNIKLESGSGETVLDGFKFIPEEVVMKKKGWKPEKMAA